MGTWIRAHNPEPRRSNRCLRCLTVALSVYQVNGLLHYIELLRTEIASEFPVACTLLIKRDLQTGQNQ
jgi:hypothetical protein